MIAPGGEPLPPLTRRLSGGLVGFGGRALGGTLGGRPALPGRGGTLSRSSKAKRPRAVIWTGREDGSGAPGAGQDGRSDPRKRRDRRRAELCGAPTWVPPNAYSL